MKILVLGGTGAMGIYLVNLLVSDGHTVSVTTRKQLSSNFGVNYIEGNAHDIIFLKSILSDGYDIIVDFMVYWSPAEFNDKMSLLLNSTGQYVFLSSSRVYACSNSPITEDSPRLLDVCLDEEYLKTDEYALAKAREENMLRHSGYSNWTIIRPYITYSEMRLQLGVFEKEIWLYRALKGKTIVFSNDIAEKFTTLTYGFDVSFGIAAIIGKSEALGNVFHITTTTPIKWEKALDIYLEVIKEKTGKNPKVLMLEKSPKTIFEISKYQILYDRLYDRTFDNAKINQFIDSKKFLKPESGLRHCLEKFIENPEFLTIDSRQQAIMDRYTGEFSSLFDFKKMKHKIGYLAYRFFNNKWFNS